MPDINPFFIADIIGIIFFTISGALVATRKKLDLLGLFIAGNLTALGGGVIRDIILDRSPISFHAVYPSLIVLITLILFIYYRWHHHDEIEQKSYFVLSDTLGLVAFSVAGAILALEADLNLFGVVVLSFITAVGGGVLRDVMINEVPAVLITDFYGSIAILTALALFGLDLINYLNPLSTLVVATFTVGIRLLAYYKKWKLPTL
jgi:uncharacterized membrane protein YeiH